LYTDGALQSPGHPILYGAYENYSWHVKGGWGGSANLQNAKGYIFVKLINDVHKSKS
jgi:hypothetical protein